MTYIIEGLKPCPFCGADVELKDVVCDFGIRCPNCGLILINGSSRELIENWNRRAVE